MKGDYKASRWKLLMEYGKREKIGNNWRIGRKWDFYEYHKMVNIECSVLKKFKNIALKGKNYYVNFWK